MIKRSKRASSRTGEWIGVGDRCPPGEEVRLGVLFRSKAVQGSACSQSEVTGRDVGAGGRSVAPVLLGAHEGEFAVWAEDGVLVGCIRSDPVIDWAV